MKKLFSIYFITTCILIFSNISESASQNEPEINFKKEKQQTLEPKDQEIKIPIKITAKNGDANKYPVKLSYCTLLVYCIEKEGIAKNLVCLD